MALWMADCLKLFGIDGKVYTHDIDVESVNPMVKERKDIEVIQGDCMKIHESFPGAKMKVIYLVHPKPKRPFRDYSGKCFDTCMYFSLNHNFAFGLTTVTYYPGCHYFFVMAPKWQMFSPQV